MFFPERETGVPECARYAMLGLVTALASMANSMLWPTPARVWLGRGFILCLVINVLADITTGRRVRPAWWALLPAAPALWTVCRFASANYTGWSLPAAAAYLLWRLCCQAPAPAHSTSDHAGAEIELGEWYLARVPFLRIPIPWVKYSLGTNFVIRDHAFGRRDTESFSNIKNWDMTNSYVGKVTGVVTFRMLPDKIGEKELESWGFMPYDFALALDANLREYQKKKA